MLKRVYVVLLCIILILSLAMSACSEKDDGETTSTTTKKTTTTTKGAETTEPESTLLSTTGETLTIGLVFGDSTLTRKDPKPPVIAKWEDMTGVVIELDMETSWDAYNTVMNTRLASGAKLPDFMDLPKGTPVMQHISSGALIRIDELMEQFAPNMTKWFDAEDGVVRGLMTATDGNIYTFPQSIVSEGGMARNAFSSRYILVRKDWMEKFDLEYPKNIDEFYDLLVWFRDNDPNGNGEKDEIPFTSSYGCLGLEGLGYLFDVHLTGSTGGGFYWDENGDIVYQWITDNFYQLLKTAAKWYKEGLINPTPVQWNDWPQIQKALGIGIGCFELTGSAGVDFLNAEAKVTDPDAWYEALTVMESINGNKFSHPQASAAGGYWGITKSCTDTELAMKFIDWAFYTDMGIGMQWYGVEGYHYDLVDGEIKYRDIVTEHAQGLYSMVADGVTKGTFPTVVTRETAYNEISLNSEEAAELAKRNEQNLAPYVIKPYPTLLESTEESETIARIMPDINTYKDEIVVKVFLGEIDIDSIWDEYVSKIKDMGIDEVIAVKEQQLARTK